MSDIRRIVVQEGVDALTALALIAVVVVVMFVEAPVLAASFVVAFPIYGALMWLSRRRVRPVLAATEEAFGRYRFAGGPAQGGSHLLPGQYANISN
jgi:ABC-type bacteriocin/lantibiotic exporter with double-glycine peptidase domain